MSDRTTAPVTVCEDPWAELRRFTAARIAVGRSGSSLPLAESLSFRLDHARARDAVHTPFRREALAESLRGAGIACVELESGVDGREEYLTRPDKGRRLSERSVAVLQGLDKGFDICLAVGDGLSARAIHENAPGFVPACVRMFSQAGLSVAPVCLVENARVAVADEIGEILRARLSVILIGERPGLSSPNSMGVYLTMNPRPGVTDEARNCISNVRDGGLSLAEGVRKLGYLVEQALMLGLSGVGLKDRMAPGHLPFGKPLPELPDSGKDTAMIIRKEKGVDAPEISRLQHAAFLNHPQHAPGAEPTEHLIVERLRQAGGLTLSLVAEEGGRLTGHIALSPARVGDCADGWLLLGPVGVLPELQGRGIGSALVREALREARDAGACGVVLVGDSEFYSRFGFRSFESLGYAGVPQMYVLAMPFGEEMPTGEISAHSAFC